MLRKLLNLIVLVAVIVAISGIFIHLYNNSKLKDNKFDTIKDTINKKKSSKKNNSKKKDNTNNKKVDDKDNTANNEEELDDNDITVNEENNNANSISGNEVAVASTGSKENIYITILGGVIIISGVGFITLKLNKDRV